MTVYADSDFYEKSYLCGKKAVIDTAFDFYSRKATQKIKQYTFDNIDEEDIPECVKMCCCEVAELIFNNEKTLSDSRGKTSESVEGWSVSYANAEQSELQLNNEVKNSVYQWLGDTGLLYSGVR